MFFRCFISLLFLPVLGQAASPVWKATAPEGGVVYLGASVHALHSSDSGLPTAFEAALGNRTVS